MKSELNRLGKANTIETTYEKGEKANDPAKYDLKAALKKTVDTVKALDDGTTKPTVAAVEAVTTTTDGAIAYVREIPSSAKKASKWTKVADDLNANLFVNAYMVVNAKGDKATIVIDYDTSPLRFRRIAILLRPWRRISSLLLLRLIGNQRI